MKQLHHVEIPEECFVCGSSPVTLYTDYEQKCECNQEGGCEACKSSWWAVDGDTVQCSDCGAIGMVSADGEVAYVMWDEESDHNVMCSENYERRTHQEAK